MATKGRERPDQSAPLIVLDKSELNRLFVTRLVNGRFQQAKEMEGLFKKEEIRSLAIIAVEVAYEKCDGARAAIIGDVCNLKKQDMEKAARKAAILPVPMRGGKRRRIAVEVFFEESEEIEDSTEGVERLIDRWEKDTEVVP